MGVADTVHRTVSCPPKKKWIHAYKQDEDRDEVTLDPAAAAATAAAVRRPAPAPPLAHQNAVSVPSPAPHSLQSPPPRGSARSPSTYIAAHHTYVRQRPAPAPAPPPAPPAPAVDVPPVPLHQQCRPPAVPAAPAAPAPPHERTSNGPGPAAVSPPGFRSEGSEPTEERKGRVSAGTREVHNKLEKNRRAHLKECFEMLRRQVPMLDDKRTSNLGILRGALRYIASLKRKERECEHEMERLAREKIANQQRLAQLKRDLSAKWDHIDFAALLPEPTTSTPAAVVNEDSNSTLSASERFEDNSYQASPEPMDTGVGGATSPEPRRRTVSEPRPSPSSPGYPAGSGGGSGSGSGGHSSGYSSSSPTVSGEAGLAGLAAMASSQEKLLVSGRQVALVSAQPGPEPQLLRTEHGVYVPVTALGSDPSRPPPTVSYVSQPGEPPRKAILLETVPTHIVPAQLMQGGGAVRLAGGAGLQLASSSLQVLTPAGVRLLSAPPAHSTGTASLSTAGTPPRAVHSLSRSPVTPPRVASQQTPPRPSPPRSEVTVSPVRQAVSTLPGAVSVSPLPRLVTQQMAHLVSPATSGGVTVLAQNKVVQQLPVVSPYINPASQQVGKAVVVVTGSGLAPASKQ